MLNSSKLNNDDKDLLRCINECCIRIAEQKKLNCKLKKLEFLEEEKFYDQFDFSNFET